MLVKSSSRLTLATKILKNTFLTEILFQRICLESEFPALRDQALKLLRTLVELMNPESGDNQL